MHTSQHVVLKAIALAVFCLTLLMSFATANGQAGLVSHWPAEGNANDVAGGNNGTLVGGAAFAPGIVGQAFSLDGVNRYIEVPDSPSLSITGPLTLAAWINTNTTAVQQAIIEKYDVPGRNGYLLRIEGGRLAANICNSSTCSTIAIGATTISTGTWHHVAGVYDGTTIKVYLDGTLDGIVPTSFTLPDGATSLKIGARGDDANTRFNGLIDEVKIYNRALSASEIQTSSSGLVSQWHAEGDALDSAGTNNGTLLNGTAFTAGVCGQAFSFDGIDDRVSVPNSPSLNVSTGDFTVGFFAKFNDLANNGNGLIHKDTYGNEAGYRGWLFNICDTCAGSPGIGIETRAPGIDTNARYPTSNFQTGHWYHIAAVRQSNILYLYVDGVLRATVAESSPTDLSNGSDLEFGSLSSGSRQNFAGALDEVNFYNRALSASEILALSTLCDTDDDNDGVPDATDNCPLISNAGQGDNDQDGIGDSCDEDDDNDGVSDTVDNCPLTANPAQTDTDGDTIGDTCDSDDDGDGVPDTTDNCSLVSNAGQADNDQDGIGDSCDEDDDNDGVSDSADNCPLTANPAQTDTDGDTIGDSCDSDDDGDGLLDTADNCPLVSNADQADNDHDGVGDSCDADDDNDLVPDATDNCPLTANTAQIDTDGDGVGDSCDSDDDNDGVADTADNCPTSWNPNQADFDGDGIGDVCDPITGPPTNKDQCKNSGWQRFDFPRVFKNQGDCIQYVNTGK